MVPDNLTVLNYPIETEEAKKFWGSRHKCNKMKSIIAFSLNLDNANDNLRRYGYTNQWRKKAIRAFGTYVNQPKMTGIPFSQLSDPWWECMPVKKTTTITTADAAVLEWMEKMKWIEPEDNTKP